VRIVLSGFATGLMPVVGAFAEPSAMGLIADLIATALLADHIQSYPESAKQTKRVFKQRTRRALGNPVHGPPRRGTARDLINHGPA